MPWSPPNTVNPGDIASATNYNQYVRDNLLYLLSGQPSPTYFVLKGSNYSTTSAAFVDVDAANLILTATVNSGRFRVIFSGYFSGSASCDGRADIIVDSTTRAGDVANGLVQMNQANTYVPTIIIANFTGLSVGSHTFKLQWKAVSGTPVLYGTVFGISMLGWEY